MCWRAAARVSAAAARRSFMTGGGGVRKTSAAAARRRTALARVAFGDPPSGSKNYKTNEDNVGDK